MKAQTARLVVLALAVAAAGCGGGEAPVREPFRAVWQAAESTSLDGEEAERLAAVGIRDLFLEAGRLGWDGDRVRLEPSKIGPLPTGFATTLVIGGRWSETPESSRSLAAGWAERIDSLAQAVRATGARPVGVHFELAVEDDAERLASALSRLRRILRGRWFVSVTLELEAVEELDAIRLSRAVDFVVADVFGQSPTAIDDPGRWDLERSQRQLERLDRLEVRYAAAAWTVGRIELRHANRTAEPVRGTPPVGRWLRSPRFAIRPGSVFAGVDRQVFVLEARQATEVGTLSLVRGDVVRIARPTTHDVEQLLALLAREKDESRRIGVVLRQLPAADDTISLRAANLAAALADDAATPALGVVLIDGGRARGRTRVRVRLRNGNAEATDLAGGEWNYVELSFAPGALGGVEPGDFTGWEQLWRGEEKRTVRALRQADTLRLFAPFVGAGETLESGVVELRGRGGARPVVRASGRFLLPGGRELKLPAAPAVWLERD